MNWTGGRLQQSKRTGTALTVKQKSYFAKARARQQHGNAAYSPLRLPLLDETQPQIDPASNIAQRKLEDYESFVPTVRQLASMKTNGRTGSRLIGSPSQKITRRARSSSSQNPRRYLDDTEHHSIHPPHYSLSLRDRADPDKVPRKRLSTEHNSSNRTATNDMEAKRLSLLAKLNVQDQPLARPLRITFPSIEEKDRVGRRRKLDRDDQQRYVEPPAKRIKPTMMQSHLRKMRSSSDFDGFPMDDVSIRFGTSIHGSQRTAMPKLPTTQRSQYSGQTPVRQKRVARELGSQERLRRSSGDLEDSMLLDAESDIMEEELPDRTYLNREHHPYTSSIAEKYRVDRYRSISNEPLDDNSLPVHHRSNQVMKNQGQNARDEPELRQETLTGHHKGDRSIQRRSQTARMTASTDRPILESTPQPLDPSSSSIAPSLFNRYITQSERSIQVHANRPHELIVDDDDEEPWRTFLDPAESLRTSGCADTGSQQLVEDVRAENEFQEPDYEVGSDLPDRSTPLPGGLAPLQPTIEQVDPRLDVPMMLSDEPKESENKAMASFSTVMATTKNPITSKEDTVSLPAKNPLPPSLDADPQSPRPYYKPPRSSENEAWYHFVFPSSSSPPNQDLGPTLSSLNNELPTSTPTLSPRESTPEPSSLLAEASSSMYLLQLGVPPPRQPELPLGEFTSSLSPSSSAILSLEKAVAGTANEPSSSIVAVAGTVHHHHHPSSPVRIVFKRPVPFGEVRRGERTVRLGGGRSRERRGGIEDAEDEEEEIDE